MPSPTSNTKTPPHQGVKFLLELGPLVLFFIANKFWGLMTATAVFIPATLITLALTWLIERRIAWMPLISGIAVTVFGGLTLFFKNETFIMIKPTLFYFGLALALLFSLITKKRLLERLLGSSLELEEKGWWVLTKNWAFFFIAMGILNEVIRHFIPQWWVASKLFLFLPLGLLFTIIQVPVLQKYMKESKGVPEQK